MPLPVSLVVKARAPSTHVLAPQMLIKMAGHLYQKDLSQAEALQSL